LGVCRAGSKTAPLRWAGRRLAGWMARRAANVALTGLDDYMLKDMGLSRRAIRSAMRMRN
jgi:uncharacterized protein YjiS (DUF1127 family)